MEDKPQDEASRDVIQRPEPVHGIEQYETDSDNELEATELRHLSQEVERLPRLSHVISPGKPMVYWYDPIKKFWRHEVRISVPHDDCRDHLGESNIRLQSLQSQRNVYHLKRPYGPRLGHGCRWSQLYSRESATLTPLQQTSAPFWATSEHQLHSQ
jgi:hypothetical protein